MIASSEFLGVDILDGGVLRLVMHQPAKKNALNATMRLALLEAIRVAGNDPSVTGLILTGAGDTYSAGGDIQGLMKVETEAFRSYLQQGHALVKALWDFEKPAVASIEGIGVGGGLALAMCCDQIVIGHSARIGFSFIKIGFVPDWGTPFTVPQRVGRAVASRLFTSGSLVTADEALRIGLVDQVVDDNAVQDTGVQIATALSQHPPRAFALTKRLMRTVPNSLDTAFEMELFAQQSCFKSDEFLDGVKPFL